MRRVAVVIDAHPLWLEAVQGVLDRLEFDLAGKTCDLDEGLGYVRDARPDVLLIEPFNHGGGTAGLDLIGEAARIHPQLKTIVLTDTDASDKVDAAFRAGASAYVLKSARPDDLAAAIRQVFDTSIFLAQPRMAVVPTETGDPVRRAASNGGLTKRELEILQLVAEGHSNAELARSLWVTEQTVKFHLSNIYRKLDVANRTEASRWAQLNGLLATPVSAVG